MTLLVLGRSAALLPCHTLPYGAACLYCGSGLSRSQSLKDPSSLGVTKYENLACVHHWLEEDNLSEIWSFLPSSFMILRTELVPGLVAHTFNPSARTAEAEGPL